MLNEVGTCPACAGTQTFEIYRLDAIPVQSCILLDTRDAAINFPRRPLILRFCDDCGFIFNSVFDSAMVDYSSTTEESQHFSDTFNKFAKELVADIAAHHDLEGRLTLEIGCGKGEFLIELVKQTRSRGLGLDPGFIPERLPRESGALLEFRKQHFDPTNLETLPDFIVCRHTLEHIPEVGRFMSDVSDVVAGRRGVGIFFETPDVRRVLAEGAYWDIYYEHCSYFSLGSHARLFRRFGMDVTRLYLAYNDQYIVQYAEVMEDSRPKTHEEDLNEMRSLARSFRDRVKERLDLWRDFAAMRYASGSRIAIWGGGSKCVSFLTSSLLSGEISYVIDINPYKQGRFLPGTGQLVKSPDALCEDPPDTVIVMNPVYLPEISDSLRDLGLNPEIVAL